MESIFRGDLSTRRGRAVAWVDSLLIDHAALRLIWRNWGVVVPGVLYRSSHPTPGQLVRARRQVGLRSLINLRGATRSGSDALSREQADRLDLTLLDIALSSGRAPDRATLVQLAETLHAAPKPALLHCKSGADRAAFASAVFILLNGGNAADALGQMSLWHGHLRRSRAGVLDAVLLRYQATAEGRLSFRDWVTSAYDADEITASFKAGGLSGFMQDRILRRE